MSLRKHNYSYKVAIWRLKRKRNLKKKKTAEKREQISAFFLMGLQVPLFSK